MRQWKWYETATGLAIAAMAFGAILQWFGFPEVRAFGAAALGAIGALASVIDNQRKRIDALQKRINRLDGIDDEE